MLHFRFLGFPVSIHWFFWLNCALLSGALSGQSETPQATRMLLAWTIVAFVSILVHELGHALTMRHYGDRRVRVVLHGLGGYAQGSLPLSRKESFYVSAAGPFVQLAAGVAVWWLRDLWMPHQLMAAFMLSQFIHISIFWALLNLLPIVPLDGGHIALALLGPHRQRLVLTISLVVVTCLGVYSFSRGDNYNWILCALLAVANWRSLQGMPQIGGMNTP